MDFRLYQTGIFSRCGRGDGWSACLRQDDVGRKRRIGSDMCAMRSKNRLKRHPAKGFVKRELQLRVQMRFRFFEKDDLSR